MRPMIMALFLAVNIFTITGCKKNQDMVRTPPALAGEWELSSISGMGGTHSFQPGNGNTCRFINGQFNQYAHDTLLRSGQYSLTSTGSLEAGTISFDSSSYKPTFSVKGDGTLAIDFGMAFDAPYNTYRKVQ